MTKVMAFSRLKNIFSRFNPLNSFKWSKLDEEIIVPPSSKELLEKAIKKYPEFKHVILIAIYPCLIHKVLKKNISLYYQRNI